MGPGEVTGRDEERIVDFSDDESLLPELPGEDRDDRWGDNPPHAEDWLREQRPPHW